jgi:transcriptional regulator with XRE-family HTH domain
VTRLNVAQVRFQLDVRGWDQGDLAEASGLTPSTVSHALSGHTIRPTTLRRVLEALLANPLDDMTGHAVVDAPPEVKAEAIRIAELSVSMRPSRSPIRRI